VPHTAPEFGEFLSPGPGDLGQILAEKQHGKHQQNYQLRWSGQAEKSKQTIHPFTLLERLKRKVFSALSTNVYTEF